MSHNLWDIRFLPPLLGWEGEKLSPEGSCWSCYVCGQIILFGHNCSLGGILNAISRCLRLWKQAFPEPSSLLKHEVAVDRRRSPLRKGRQQGEKEEMSGLLFLFLWCHLGPIKHVNFRCKQLEGGPVRCHDITEMQQSLLGCISGWYLAHGWVCRAPHEFSSIILRGHVARGHDRLFMQLAYNSLTIPGVPVSQRAASDVTLLSTVNPKRFSSPNGLAFQIPLLVSKVKLIMPLGAQAPGWQCQLPVIVPWASSPGS